MTADLPEITATEAAQRRDAGAALLDVREMHEVAAGMAPGAVHIPLGDLPTRAPELDQSIEWLAICRVGGRSLRATEWLRAQGYRVVNVAGGMQAWAAAGLPVETAGGRPGRVV